MKKKITSLILSTIIAIGVLGGCRLVTVNSKRDMNQVVATVTTTAQSGTYSDNIYKKDLVSYFNSAGYYYVQQGQSYAETYKQIMDALVNNKIFLHEAKRYFNNLNTALNINSKLDEYLLEWENVKATYNVNSAVNNLLDSFESDIISEKKQNAKPADDYLDKPGYKEDARALISDDINKEIEVTEENYTESKIKNYKLNIAEPSKLIGSTAETRKKAYAKMIMAIDYYNLLGSPTFDEFVNSDFYKDELKRQRENILIEKYTTAFKENVLIEGMQGYENAEKVITYDELLEKYNKKFNDEKEKYTASVTEYKTALDSLTKDSYVLFNPEFEDTYGFVYNILIPFDKIQEFKIKDLANKYKTEVSSYQKEFNAIIKSKIAGEIDLTGEEQRASWIAQGHDFIVEGDKIYFDESLYAAEISESYKGLAFKGTATEIKENNKFVVTADGKKVYDIAPEKVSFDELFDEFISIINGTFVGDTKINQYNAFFNDGKTTLYTGKAGQQDLLQTRNKVRDFVFAYSTDPGSLSGYLGYAVPNSGFVEEFSEGAKLAVEQGEGGFSVVITSYGLHIMYCTKVIEPNDENATFNDEYFLPELAVFKTDINDKESFSYKFSVSYLEQLQSSYWSRHRERIIKEYNTDENVVIYSKRYKDLIYD